MLTMKWLLLNFSAFYIVLSCETSFAQNNLNVVDSFVTEITDEIHEASGNEIQKNLIVEINKLDKNLSGYLRTKITNDFSNYNYNVFRNFPKDTSFECTVLEIQNSNILINYSEPFSENLFGKTLVTRSINLTLEGQLYNYSDKKIILPIKIKKLYTDRIKYDEIEIMEESPFNFTIGAKAGITFWQQILEPAIVTTSVLTVLLLLFTQRS